LPESDEEKSVRDMHQVWSTSLEDQILWLMTLTCVKAEEDTQSWSSRLSATGKKYGFAHALASEEMGNQYLVDFDGPHDP
jgi:hypothetical protein